MEARQKFTLVIWRKLKSLHKNLSIGKGTAKNAVPLPLHNFKKGADNE